MAVLRPAAAVSRFPDCVPAETEVGHSCPQQEESMRLSTRPVSGGVLGVVGLTNTVRDSAVIRIFIILM